MPTNFEHCVALVREADHDRYLPTLFAPAKRRQLFVPPEVLERHQLAPD